MRSLAESLKWIDFLRSYETHDPEPAMRQVKNQYNHYRSGERGERLVCSINEYGYDPEDVMDHIAWHKRMTEAWRKTVAS